jgi:urease accessory protein
VSTATTRAVSVSALAALLMLALPAPAHAHLVTTGLGPLYDGISHVLLSPDDLIPAIAFALLAGLNGPVAGRLALFLLPATWLAAGLTGHALGAASAVPQAVTTASFLVLGGLTALDRRLSPGVVAGLALAVGGIHGWLNGVSIAPDENAALGLFGIAASVFVMLALASAAVIALPAAWMRIAVRVAGSWVAAILASRDSAPARRR